MIQRFFRTVYPIGFIVGTLLDSWYFPNEFQQSLVVGLLWPLFFLLWLLAEFV